LLLLSIKNLSAYYKQGAKVGVFSHPAKFSRLFFT